MTTMEAKNITHKKFINNNLISLKCLFFVFFGGMGCLLPFLSLHMRAIGLTMDDIRMVSIISPLVALFGPLLAGPVADKLAGRQGTNSRASTGRYLRIMIAIACVLSAVFYCLLLTIPTVKRLSSDEKPALLFACDENGGVIYQSHCSYSDSCYQWPETKTGPVPLDNCHYRCRDIHEEPPLYAQGLARSSEPNTTEFDQDDPVQIDADEISDWIVDIQQRMPTITEDMPYFTYSKRGENHRYAYTNNSDGVVINVSLTESLNSTMEGLCVYSIGSNFSCIIPGHIITAKAMINESCAVVCDLNDAYDIEGSLLAENQCQQFIGDPYTTFQNYIILRSIADIFPSAAVTLLDAAVVIATRETSCGRGDVGRQLAFGSLGFAIFAPLVGYLNTLVDPFPAYVLPVSFFAVLMLVSALIAISANGMPLSPPEWWWQTRSGMLALPMSAVKRYSCETAALVFVLMVLGVFWSAMDSYLPLYLSELGGSELLIGLTFTVGSLPAIIFLWRSEHLVDYCGHSNLLITAFTIYIIRFTGLSLIADPWWSLLAEVLEMFTLGVMWVTAILYLRHLVPRHLTVTAQALPVIAHFCIGRCIGAVISAYAKRGETAVETLPFVYTLMAVLAAAVALMYFALYHGLLKPRCHAQTIHGPRQPPTVMQAMNGNGNYTPLRVYHNGRGRKGQFRY